MAINFLDNIQLNHNQILGARIENVTSDPTSANGGDIIFNSTTGKLKYYDGTTPFSTAGWISLPDGTGIDGSGTVGAVPVFVTNTTTLGDSQLQTSGSGSTQTFTFNTQGVTAFKSDIEVAGNLFLDPVAGKGGLKDKDGDLGTSGQLLSSTGTATNWIDAPVSYTNWKIDSNGNNNPTSVNDGDLVEFSESSTIPGVFPQQPSKTGTTITYSIGLHTKNMASASPSAYSTDVLLWGTNTNATSFKVQQTHIDDIPVSAWGQAGATVDMGDNFIIKVLDPVNAQDAATKNYVDNAIVGGFNVKGGFNAATGVTAVAGTNLYTNTAVAVGDYYVVTVAGNFFGNANTPLTVGDSVLAQTAAASGSAQESNFAVIQSDTDLATASSVGIGNVANSTANNNEGLSLSYSNGTATVGFNIKNNLSAASALADDDQIAIFQGSSGSQGNKSLNAQLIPTYVSSKNSFAGNNSSSGTSHQFIHNLDSTDVMVQLLDVSTNETVYATTENKNASKVIVTTASSIAAGAIRALITKIG